MKELDFSPYTLVFTKEGEEDKYEAVQIEKDLPLLRYLSLLAFIIELMYSLKDLTWSVNLPAEVVNFRLYYLTPLMLITFLLSYSRWIKNHVNNMYLLSILVMLSLILGQYYMTAMNESPDSSYAKTLPLIFFSTYLFTGIKFKHVLIITPWLIICYILVIVYFETLSVTAKINDTLLVLMNVFLAIFFKYILEKNRRRAYVRLMIIEQNEKMLRKNLLDEKTLSSLRKDLIGILAHDIRAPLGNLQNIITLLDAKTISSDRGEQLLGQVSERIKVITKGVNDLLIWVKSKEEGLELEISNFSAEQFISEILKIGQEQIEAKKVIVKTDIDSKLMVSSDKGTLQTIVRNLLSNAIKFSSLGDEIQINIYKKKKKVHFEVQDSGIGMDEGTIKRVHDAFYTTPGTNQESGIGLGLQICFTLIEKLKSKINIESEKGVGTKMSFII